MICHPSSITETQCGLIKKLIPILIFLELSLKHNGLNPLVKLCVHSCGNVINTGKSPLVKYALWGFLGTWHFVACVPVVGTLKSSLISSSLSLRIECLVLSMTDTIIPLTGCSTFLGGTLQILQFDAPDRTV